MTEKNNTYSYNKCNMTLQEVEPTFRPNHSTPISIGPMIPESLIATLMRPLVSQTSLLLASALYAGLYVRLKAQNINC